MEKHLSYNKPVCEKATQRENMHTDMRGGKRENAGRKTLFEWYEKIEITRYYERQFYLICQQVRATHPQCFELQKLYRLYTALRHARKKRFAEGILPKDLLSDDAIEDLAKAALEQMRVLHHQELGDDHDPDPPDAPRHNPTMHLGKRQISLARKAALFATAEWCRKRWPNRIKRTDGKRFVLKCIAFTRTFED